MPRRIDHGFVSIHSTKYCTLVNEAIVEVLEQFDFSKVKKVMRLLDWKYSDQSDALYKPKKKHLRDTALYLLQSAVFNAKETSNLISRQSTGGFVAEADLSDLQPQLKLAFQVEEFETWYTQGVENE